MRLLLVFGTRPEAIKMAPIVAASRRVPHVEVSLCVTAQHRDMLDQVLRTFALVPDYDLNIMTRGQDLFDITSRVLVGMREVIAANRPDCVLVQGDTTTTFAAALAAYYSNVPIGHVEAGLRTRNLRSPFPEEANRQLTTRLAQFHFVPTEGCKRNLLSENVEEESIHLTGNTVVDALLATRDIVMKKPVESFLGFLGEATEKYIDFQRTVLVTTHRRESFGPGIANISAALQSLATNFPRVAFVIPVHPNPNVRPIIEAALSDHPNVFLCEPMDYETFVFFMARSELILTDSGGVQEEAPSLGKPVLVMRDNTERVEGVQEGVVELVGAVAGRITSAATSYLEGRSRWNQGKNPYGDGWAADRIVSILSSILPSPPAG